MKGENRKYMTKELVSIILLSEKSEKRYLIETLRSVQAQTYENWELPTSGEDDEMLLESATDGGV